MPLRLLLVVNNMLLLWRSWMDDIYLTRRWIVNTNTSLYDSFSYRLRFFDYNFAFYNFSWWGLCYNTLSDDWFLHYPSLWLSFYYSTFRCCSPLDNSSFSWFRYTSPRSICFNLSFYFSFRSNSVRRSNSLSQAHQSKTRQ